MDNFSDKLVACFFLVIIKVYEYTLLSLLTQLVTLLAFFMITIITAYIFLRLSNLQFHLLCLIFWSCRSLCVKCYQ